MKILPVVLLCLLAACSGPAQYERGSPVRPIPAPTFSPTEDAPHTTGQPGWRGEPVPRGKDKRILPPSKEAGLWSADGARASNRPPGMTPRMYRKHRDIRDVPQPDGITVEAWAKCWVDVQEALNADPRTDAIGGDEYECLRMKLLEACGAAMIVRAKSGEGGFAKNEKELRAYNTELFVLTQGRLTNLVCGGETDRDVVNDLWPDLLKSGRPHWDAKNTH